MALIGDLGMTKDALIVDIEGGISPLAAELLQRGYRDIWVLNILQAALARAHAALGPGVAYIHWIGGTQARLPAAYFSVWHD